jgi:AI-2 transport protein TqsA
MFLSVPIKVAAMIVCSHVPGLRPMAVLLSREGLPDLDTDLPNRFTTARMAAATGTSRVSKGRKLSD